MKKIRYIAGSISLKFRLDMELKKLYQNSRSYQAELIWKYRKNAPNKIYTIILEEKEAT